MIPRSSDRLSVAYQSAVVLFDPGSGEIRHIHQVFTMQGGRHPSEEDIELEARRHAADTPIPFLALGARAAPGRLEALHVDPTELKVSYLGVDVAARKLVLIPPEFDFIPGHGRRREGGE
jgi:hypothetical protein